MPCRKYAGALCCWVLGGQLLPDFLMNFYLNLCRMDFPKSLSQPQVARDRDQTNLPPGGWGGSLRGCQGPEREEGHTATWGHGGRKSEASWAEGGTKDACWGAACWEDWSTHQNCRLSQRLRSRRWKQQVHPFRNPGDGRLPNKLAFFSHHLLLFLNFISSFMASHLFFKI